MNKYGIPEKDERRIRARDKTCVYCHKKMIYPCVGDKQRDWATIEHLNYLPPWNNPETVAICCGSCNSSRGNKKLPEWFNTPYCLEKNISLETVENIVRRYIESNYEI